MISIGITLWGDPFQNIPRDEITPLERIISGYLCAIQALDAEPFDLRVDIGEPRTDPGLLQVEVTVGNLPKEPSTTGIVIPGTNDDIPGAIRDNIKHQVERFCDDRDIGVPTFKFDFKD